MDSNISIIKGIHPGLILERELKKRKLAKGTFAHSINEFPQTITTITKEKNKKNIFFSVLDIENITFFLSVRFYIMFFILS